MKLNKGQYSLDILGDDFQQTTLALEDDYEGEVVATIIRKKSLVQSSKAVLYIHGFNDYFFQSEMANHFNSEGFNFYALDLRKYGRSFLSHQKLNNVRSLEEYDEEINKTLQLIHLEENNKVVLLGHSTGGLIVTNYAGRHLNSSLFHCVICNSPFYEFNLNSFERKIGIPILSFLGKYIPNNKISSGLSKFYGHSLHKDMFGEWSYNLNWKPHEIPKVGLSFIRAIHNGHKNIQNHLKLNVPLLVMHSDKTIYEKKWTENFMHGDAVLNVQHIEYYAKKIKGDVTTHTINNGMHDLFLSKIPVRNLAYKTLFDWLKTKID